MTFAAACAISARVKPMKDKSHWMFDQLPIVIPSRKASAVMLRKAGRVAWKYVNQRLVRVDSLIDARHCRG